jgi:hypothetical protein
LYAPPAVQRTTSCFWHGDQLAGWQHGEPLPAGLYHCNCPEQASVEIEAASCEAAMVEACDADLDAPEPCAEGAALCWPEKDAPGSWGCSCGGDSSALTFHEAERCERALFDECAMPTCAGDFGACARVDDGIGFACECADGSIAFWPESTQCTGALFRCQPDCEGGAGSCSRRYDGFDCSCAADSGEVVQVSNDDAYGACPLALELGCGTPPVGESCTEEDEHGTVVCVADGAGDWACTCDRKEEESQAPAPDEAASDVPEVDTVTNPGVSVASGVVIAPHPAPPASVGERAFECYDAIWTACD